MRALMVVPEKSHPAVLTEVAEPVPTGSQLLVDGIGLGICGTDREIVAGDHGSPPPGRDRWVLGHESAGRVIQAPAESGFSVGDVVVGVVRRPDPEPCGACARGEFDMCRNGEYTECGIRQLDGYGSQRWTVEPEYAVRVDAALRDVAVLVEPTSVVAKAWEQIELIGARSWFEPRTVLVTGAGPIGLLAALLGVQRGLDVHVLDQVTSGPKPRLVTDLGATYHHEDITDVAPALRPDIVVEATGVAKLVFETMAHTAAFGISCLTGVSSAGRTVQADMGSLNRDIVLENDVVFGSVNANLRHYQLAASALARADLDWLGRLITRWVPLSDFTAALDHTDGDVKVVLDLQA